MKLAKMIFICLAISQFVFTGISMAGEKKPKVNKEAPKIDVTPPKYITLGSFGLNNLLNIECEGEEPFSQINCNMTIIKISKADDIEKNKNKNEMDQLHKLSQKELKDMKDSLSVKDIEKRKSLMAHGTTEQKTYFADFIDVFNAIEKANNVSDVKGILRKFYDVQENTCKLKLWHAETTFKRISENKWVANPGPQGLCNVIRIQTLENTKEYPMLWKFSEVTVSTDTDSPLCEGLDKGLNKPIVYSWDAPKSMKFDCKYIEYNDF